MSTDIRLDLAREQRIGLPEAVLCSGKSPDDIARIIELDPASRRLFTRLDSTRYTALAPWVRERLDYDPVSATAFTGEPRAPLHPARIAVVAAGTSDRPVVGEVERCLAFAGEPVERFVDCGVAGLWRLLECRDAIAAHPVVIAVAGMEGALFSVLGGLVPGLVVAVPSSVGYGVAKDGHAALSAALSSCAPGIVTVNIDNGYGAACAALRFLHQLDELGAVRGKTSKTGSELAPG